MGYKGNGSALATGHVVTPLQHQCSTRLTEMDYRPDSTERQFAHLSDRKKNGQANLPRIRLTSSRNVGKSCSTMDQTESRSTLK